MRGVHKPLVSYKGELKLVKWCSLIPPEALELVTEMKRQKLPPRLRGGLGWGGVRNATYLVFRPFY
jgi:hypothetical protein